MADREREREDVENLRKLSGGVGVTSFKHKCDIYILEHKSLDNQCITSTLDWPTLPVYPQTDNILGAQLTLAVTCQDSVV